MTTILIFWACAIGTFCTQPSDATHLTLHGNIVLCEEVQAFTDLPIIDSVLASGQAPRHDCQPAGDNL